MIGWRPENVRSVEAALNHFSARSRRIGILDGGLPWCRLNTMPETWCLLINKTTVATSHRAGLSL